MSAFNDDDLERLKEIWTEAQTSGWSHIPEMEFNSFLEEHLEALLGRLEAAEKVVAEAEKVDFTISSVSMPHPFFAARVEKAVKAWRKSAGKDAGGEKG